MKSYIKSLFKPSTLFILVSLFAFSSCEKEEDEETKLSNTGVNRGDVFPNAFVFTLTSKSDTSNSVAYQHVDLDGIGGNPPSISDTVIFPIAVGASQASFFGNLRLLNNGVDVTGNVLANNTRYAICYREFNFFELAQNGFDTDQNGNNLGLNTEWLAKIRGRKGTIKITMNYNQQPKDGTCDAGSRVYEALLPFSIE